MNNSQNTQITLAQKIFSVFDEENSTDSLKGEHVFPDEAIFEQASNLLNFSSEPEQVMKIFIRKSFLNLKYVGSDTEFF